MPLWTRVRLGSRGRRRTEPPELLSLHSASIPSAATAAVSFLVVAVAGSPAGFHRSSVCPCRGIVLNLCRDLHDFTRRFATKTREQFPPRITAVKSVALSRCRRIS